MTRFYLVCVVALSLAGCSAPPDKETLANASDTLQRASDVTKESMTSLGEHVQNTAEAAKGPLTRLGEMTEDATDHTVAGLEFVGDTVKRFTTESDEAPPPATAPPSRTVMKQYTPPND